MGPPKKQPSKCRNCLAFLCPCFFKEEDEFGGKLSLHNSLVTTKRKFKPWDKLDQAERKDRVDYLWKQTRRYFWQQVIMFRIAKSSEANIQVTVLEEDDMLMHNRGGNDEDDSEDPFEKWYLINQTKTLPQIWEMIMNAFTIYSLFATPFM